MDNRETNQEVVETRETRELQQPREEEPRKRVYEAPAFVFTSPLLQVTGIDLGASA